MKQKELLHITIATIVLSIIIGFSSIINLELTGMGLALLFALIIIFINIGAKKLMAAALDADVEHELWQWSRWGIKAHQHLRKPVPIGVILPVFVTAFSIGTIKLMTLLTYETKALKRRAAKRFGHYSFTEMTDWHNALVGMSGIIAVLFLSFITYWLPNLEFLARMSAFYAFFNMLPISKLDGTQIYFGSRILWYALAIITLIFATYAIILI